jgi:hypothetical protein
MVERFKKLGKTTKLPNPNAKDKMIKVGAKPKTKAKTGTEKENFN